jgi:hypothetical protein
MLHMYGHMLHVFEYLVMALHMLHMYGHMLDVYGYLMCGVAIL